MKYAVAALAVALGLAVAGNVVQALPDKASAPKHSGAYLRADKLWSSLQHGNWKAACDVLEWYTLNQGATGPVCQEIMQGQFGGSKLVYEIVGESQSSAKYSVVTVKVATDNPSTKVNESAVCAKQWADGKDCKYAGTYSFGMALFTSPTDSFSGKKHAPVHWYVMWVD